MTYIPTFQPQNPALSHYALGWSSCTAFSAAMAIDYDSLGKIRPSGGQVRGLTHDTVGGLTLPQVDRAALDGWDVNLNTSLGIAWTDVVRKIDAGCAAILQGWYSPIADTKFDAGRGFRGNHAVLVLPGWIVMDPLADGRYGEAYKFHGEVYPRSLMRAFAGQLNLGDTRLGDGKAYASFTRDNVHSYHVTFTGGAFWTYRVGHDGKIASRDAVTFHSLTGAPCTPPRTYLWPGQKARTLVRITAGILKDDYVAVPQSTLHLDMSA